MSDRGSSVTLILYSLDPGWMSGAEPFLNLVAAAAQRSSFTHVELAIGEDAGAHGEMVNVLRIFNDACGCELTHRTGKNPNYQYVQIGCSQRAVSAMLQFARAQVGKPFSSIGMFRSMVYPRTTTGDSWYCAELVAACLKVGGLMSSDSNPGAATPHSLYKMYKRQGAVMANPCTLRQQFGSMPVRPLTLSAPSTSRPAAPTHGAVPPARNFQINSVVGRPTSDTRRRSDSPPRMEFKTLQPRASDSRAVHAIELSLASLSMDRRQ